MPAHFGTGWECAWWMSRATLSHVASTPAEPRNGVHATHPHNLRHHRLSSLMMSDLVGGLKLRRSPLVFRLSALSSVLSRLSPTPRAPARLQRARAAARTRADVDDIRRFAGPSGSAGNIPRIFNHAFIFVLGNYRHARSNLGASVTTTQWEKQSRRQRAAKHSRRRFVHEFCAKR